MVKIDNHSLLNSYILKYKINDLFENDMTEHMQLVKFEKNETILMAGEELEYIYLHVRGIASIQTALENGKSLLLRFSTPLTALGDVEIIESKKVQRTVKAENECIFIRISVKSIHNRCYNDPKFLRYLISEMSFKICGISKSAPINLLYPLKERLMSYLISLEDGADTSKDGIRTYKIKEMSELLGTSYRHLNRTISELIDEGIVERNNGKLTILDLERLRKADIRELYE